MFQKLRNNMKLYLTEDLFKVLKAVTVVSFNYTFTRTYSGRIKYSKILESKNILKTTDQTLLNELFLLDQNDNEHILRII